MGLRDIIRAVREYPAAQRELETTRFELRQARRELKQGRQDRESLAMELVEQKDHTDMLSRQSEALRDVLMEFCPRLASTEEIRRFYDTVSPGMDAQGFTLYRMAEELTGIDVPSFFPYEDNRGLFELMDGRQLLRYLTAAYFRAVEWEIVPGTANERTILREVDTSTPAYRAFEKQLYEKVLERMGFQDILASGQEVSQPTELKLYSPLCAELAEPEYDHRVTLDGSDLIAFQDVILRGIEDERMPEEEERGLMAYFDGPDAVDEKVVSIFPTVEDLDGVLCGVAVCQIRGKLSHGELTELKEYCAAQYSDSWGEGVRERPRHTEYGELYVSFWQDGGAALLTKEELDRASGHVSRHIRKERGGSR